MSTIGAKLLRVFVLSSMLLGYMPAASSQTTTTGAVEGKVFLLGAPAQGVPGATILVRNEDTGLERSVASDASGAYFFGTLPPGDYTITVTATGYEPRTLTSFPVRLSKKNLVIPPIGLQSTAVAVTPPTAGTPPGTRPTTPPTTPPQTTPTPTAAPTTVGTSTAGSGSEQLTNTSDASRGQNLDRRTLIVLPLPGVRTVDDLAFLSPGVALPPQAIGSSVGPGIGAGVGTSGQFSVNGMRSRSNNFTIDGSDNNDEDIGVRRQGFTSLTPQTIDSLQEFQIITLLPEPQFGRKPGAQVNAVSRAGGTQVRGTVYGFLTNRALRAGDPFDFTGGPATFPIIANGQQVLLDGQPLAPNNPVGDESSFNQGRFGFVLGGPIARPNSFFFVSAERQQLNASKESHFAVPTVEERGLFNAGAVGLETNAGDPVFPTSLLGDSIFSLFPFPNNPIGPYGANTYTAVLPANAHGNVFSARVDQQNISAFGKNHSLAGRYNFTDDATTLPVTGEALFSSLLAKVRTQNLSLILDSALSLRATNQFRFSYGRTRLSFREVRDPFLLPAGERFDAPGSFIDKTEFLLNAPRLLNNTLPGRQPNYLTRGTTEPQTGLLGQVIVSGFSPVGVDVFNFPQGRTNNTFQFADTIIYSRGSHTITAGADIRRVQLNSFLDRNSRPLATFRGAQDISGIGGVGVLFGNWFAAAGAPTGFYQSQALFPDSTIGLRYWQNAFFLSDQIRVSPRFTLTLGVRYDLNTVPTEVNRRIESTFDSQDVKNFIALERQFGSSGLEQFLGGRTEIFELDKNNFGPHVAFAWDPFGYGTTSIRAGYGIYYDTIPGAVISQSRNVFPSFLTVNTAGFKELCLSTENELVPCPQLSFFNPQFAAKPGTLNTFDRSVFENFLGTGDLSEIYLALAVRTNLSGGPAFVLPSNDLQTPYAHHWGLTVEHQLKGDFLLSAGYVGTRGVHLLRFATPNLGPNAIPVVEGIFRNQTPGDEGPVFNGRTVPPNFLRPFPLLGSFTSIESDANSSYHALQLQANKRFAHRFQFTTAYTWSHAIDEVSDLFDLAGSTALPQNSFDRRSERADANFDVRHRFVYSFIWDLPLFEESNVWGGWQLASIGSFQTGQPYSLLFCCDINIDGNLTDRITSDLTLPGNAPRNALRAPGIKTIDASLNKIFRFSERHNLEFRTEVFNLANHPNYGIPVHQLFFGGLAARPATERVFTDTRTPPRTIQFGLKFNF